MLKRIPHPSPALVIALVALFVALSGTAVAAGIVPHAKLADNSTKLQGKTAAQVAQMAPQPASLAGYITVKSAAFNLAADAENDFSAACDAGSKAIAGGYDNAVGAVFQFESRPTPDGSGWRTYLANASSTAGVSGTVYAVCLR